MDAAAIAALTDLTPEQIATLNVLVRGLNVGAHPPAAGARPGRVPHVKNIPVSPYTIGQDFESWLILFIDNIRAVFGLDPGDAEVTNQALKWISTKLTVGPTRAVYENLEAATKADWDQLKAALSEAYTDENEKLTFLARLDAHQRGEGVSLRTYKDALLLKMAKYQGGLKTVAAEWDRVALQRFREGLNNPMLKAHLMLNCPDDSSNVEEAFKCATTWENTINQIGRDTKTSGAGAMMSALMGIPAVSNPSQQAEAINPRMGALGTEAPQPMSTRIASLEAKVKTNEMHVAELRDGMNVMKTGMEEFKKEMGQGFRDLTKEIRTLSQPQASTQRQYNSQGYTPAFGQNQQYRNQSGFRPRGFNPNFQRQTNYATLQPRVTPGLTNGPGFVNNQPSPLRKPQPTLEANQVRAQV